METEVFRWLQVGGMPTAVVLVGFFAYRWLNLRLNSIDVAIQELNDGKRWSETCDAKHVEVNHRLERLERIANGKLTG